MAKVKNIQSAVQAAMDFFADIYANEPFSDILLEEVETDEASNQWRVTIGYSHPVSQSQSTMVPTSIRRMQRSYKRLTIDSETGKVTKMEIRTPGVPVG